MPPKVIIIPDIHNKHDIAESIIGAESPCQTVFLGDYFDSVGDDARTAKGTAAWLAWSLGRKDRIHLVGNHDLHYMTDNPNFLCSGYSPEKKSTIDQYDIDWTRLRLYFWIQHDWLCTHAGLSNRFFVLQQRGRLETVVDVLRRSDKDLKDLANVNVNHPFLQAGMLRGGRHSVGGLVWCDYEEFEDVPGVRQIFGHTRGPHVRHHAEGDAEHYCIDTVLRNYAVYEDRQLSVRSVEACLGTLD